jgi:hypothetical protein
MDEIEAHYLVKWEREAIVHRANYGVAVGVPFDETKWLGTQWFEDEDG